jgi:hypothetical protein
VTEPPKQPGREMFVDAVEELLERRKNDPPIQTPGSKEAERDFSTPSKFTLEESYFYCPWFRDLRKGKTKGVPPRADILDMAKRYRCKLEETNTLLVAAGYAPEVLYLQGSDLEHALDQTESLIHYLPLPGYVMTRDWNIQRWNDGCNRLFNMTDELFGAMPTKERNVLRFIFDPETPVHPILSSDREWWEYTAWLNVYWVKQENVLCQFDDWYTELVDYLHQFPRFAEFWEKVQPGTMYKGTVAPTPFPAYETEIQTLAGDKVRVRGVHTFYVATDYPRAVLYVPADDESRKVFEKYGFATPDNGWVYTA